MGESDQATSTSIFASSFKSIDQLTAIRLFYPIMAGAINIQREQVLDESNYLNKIAEMIMKKEDDRLALANIKNRIGSQVAGQPEETAGPADPQERQQPETRKYQLHNAFRELGDGTLETIERLLAQGADVEEKDESGLTILQYVVGNPAKHCLDVIKILHKYGANLREEGFHRHCKRLLQRAIENQNQWTAPIVEYLLEQGAYVNFKDKYGSTALHYAALDHSKNTVDVLTILLRQGANVNDKDKWGLTPLHYVARQKTEWTASIVEYLLEQGADVNSKDELKRTALHHATWSQSKHTVDVLTILLRQGANVNVKNNKDHTALHYAAREKTEWTASIVKHLLEQGADVNSKDELKLTALHHAAGCQSKHTVDVLTILLRQGANVNDKDNRGKTPLHCAAQGQTEWTASIVEYLKKQGAVQ